MSATADINMINLQVYAQKAEAAAMADGTYAAKRQADRKAFIWQSRYQTIPEGTETDPVGYARALRKALPLVNALRIPFNFWSFNPDGSLDPRFEAFLAEAVKQKFRIVFVYMDGEGQRYGRGMPPGPDSAQKIYDALQDEVAERATKSFDLLQAWMGAHADVGRAVYGLEMMNEPAAFKTGLRWLDKHDVAGQARFVALYAKVMVALAKHVEQSFKGRILIGGFAYSADFNILGQTRMPQDGSLTALDYIRRGVGPALVWSAHLYPGWLDTGKTNDPARVARALEGKYRILGSDDILLTETNAPAHRTYNLQDLNDKSTIIALNYEWFSDHGIGIAWFKGAQKSASGFVTYRPGKPLLFNNLQSYGAGMDAYSLGDGHVGAAGQRLTAAVIPGEVQLQRTDPLYFIDHDASGGAKGIAFATGDDGNDTIAGAAQAVNFLYGGKGNDRITGSGAGDYLYGQDGNDTLTDESPQGHLFGGRGNDLLVTLGPGFASLWGGPGGDRFSLDTRSKAVIADFDPRQGDTVDFRGHYASLAEVLKRTSTLDYDGDGVPDLMVWHDDGGYAIFLGMGDRLLEFARALVEFPVPQALPKVTGTIRGNPFTPQTGLDPDGPPHLPAPERPKAELPPGPGRTVKAPKDGGLVLGTQGDDQIFARGVEGEVIVGGDGNDVIHNRRGGNTIFTGNGNDQVETGKFGATVVAGDGRDTIDLDMGHAGSRLWLGRGGAEIDVSAVGVFRKAGQYAETQIYGFDPARDRILFKGQPVDFAHLPAEMSYGPVGGGRVLSIDTFARLYLYPPGTDATARARQAAETAAFDPRFDPAEPTRHLQ